jgi:hypothetical protein
VGPTWAHLSEACVGLRGSALATLGQAHKALKAQPASPRGNPRGTFQKRGVKTCPLLFPPSRRPRAWRRGQGSRPAPHIREAGAQPPPTPTLAAGQLLPLHLSLSRLCVGEALPQKLSTISTTPSCCRSNLCLHHTCWTKEGGDVAAPYVCISRRRRHLQRRIGSDREEEMASTTTSTTFY